MLAKGVFLFFNPQPVFLSSIHNRNADFTQMPFHLIRQIHFQYGPCSIGLHSLRRKFRKYGAPRFPNGLRRMGCIKTHMKVHSHHLFLMIPCNYHDIK
jgi:hypothetical protein